MTRQTLSNEEFEARIADVRAGNAAAAALEAARVADTPLEGAVVTFPTVLVVDGKSFPLRVSREPGSVFTPGLTAVDFSVTFTARDEDEPAPFTVEATGTFHVGVGVEAPRRQVTYTSADVPDLTPGAWLVELPSSQSVPALAGDALTAALTRTVTLGERSLQDAALCWEPAVFLHRSRFQKSIRRIESHYSLEDAYQDGMGEVIRGIHRFASADGTTPGRPSTTFNHFLHFSVPNKIRDALDREKSRGTKAQSGETGKIRAFKRLREQSGVVYANAEALRDDFAFNTEVNKHVYGPENVSRPVAEERVRAAVAAGELELKAKFGLKHFEIAMSAEVGFSSMEQPHGQAGNTLGDVLADPRSTTSSTVEESLGLQQLFEERQLTPLEQAVIALRLSLYDADHRQESWVQVSRTLGITGAFEAAESGNDLLRQLFRSGQAKLTSDLEGFYERHRDEAAARAAATQAKLAAAHQAQLRLGQEPTAVVPSVAALTRAELDRMWQASLGEVVERGRRAEARFEEARARVANRDTAAREAAAVEYVAKAGERARARMLHPTATAQLSFDLALGAGTGESGRAVGTVRTPAVRARRVTSGPSAAPAAHLF